MWVYLSLLPSLLLYVCDSSLEKELLKCSVFHFMSSVIVGMIVAPLPCSTSDAMTPRHGFRFRRFLIGSVFFVNAFFQ